MVGGSGTFLKHAMCGFVQSPTVGSLDAYADVI